MSTLHKQDRGTVVVVLAWHMSAIKWYLRKPPAVVPPELVAEWEDNVSGAKKLYDYLEANKNNQPLCERYRQALVSSHCEYLLR